MSNPASSSNDRPPSSGADAAATADAAGGWSHIALGLVLAAVAIVGLLDIATNAELAADTAPDPGPAFLPWLLLWLLLAGGIAHAGMAALRLPARTPEHHRADAAMPQRPALSLPPWQAFRRSLIGTAMPAAMVASLIVYERAILTFGYLAPSFLFAFGWLAVLQSRETRTTSAAGVVRSALEAAAAVGAIFILFRFGIQVPLP